MKQYAITNGTTRIGLILHAKTGRYKVVLNSKTIGSYASYGRAYVLFVDSANEHRMLHLIVD